MILCDLCNQPNECSPKEIDGKLYDICADCWKTLAEKLKGKGRVKKQREALPNRSRRTEPATTVFLPQAPAPEEPKTLPRQPPKIWGVVDRPQ